jgi:hypothetical protein
VYDELEDTKGLIGICKSEGKKDKRTNNDPQNIKPKTKDRATRTALISADELMCPGRESSTTCRFILATNPAR